MIGKNYKASVTVFLSMIMLLLIGLVMSLMEVTRIQNMKSYRRVAAEGAIESVFAEYHVGLYEKYGLFALDAGYRGTEYSLDNVLERYDYYGGTFGDSDLELVQLMTDNQGAAFLDQIMFYMTDAGGLGVLENVLEWTSQWEAIDIEEGMKGEGGLSELEGMKDALIDEVDNPLAEFLDFDMKGILHLVVEDIGSLSKGEVDLDELCSQRELEYGIGTSVTLDTGDAINKLVLSEYVLDKFENMTEDENPSDDRCLKYKLEYLIGGQDTDQENLKSVVHKLILLRTPVNYTCLKGDSIKRAEVNILATTLALATGAVGTESIISESLLWAWSYAESIAEVKSLLLGHSLTLVKSSNQWQLDLSGLLNFGGANLPVQSQEGGMEYKEFLRILLYLESLETLTTRTMDMVELEVRNMEGYESFQLDYCINRLGMNIEADVGMGYSYSFPIEFGYR